MLICLSVATIGWPLAGGAQRTGEGMGEALAHLILPVLASMIVEVGGPIRYAQASVLDAPGQDCIRAGMTGGPSRPRVLVGHVPRNAPVPAAKVLANGVGYLPSRCSEAQTIFAWRGMGQPAPKTVTRNDHNLAPSCLLLTPAAGF